MKRRGWLTLCALILLLSPAARAQGLLDEYDRPGVRIGVDTGSMAMSAAEKLFTNATIEYFTSVADCVLAIAQGRVDAYAHDRETLNYICQTQPGFAVLDESFGKTSIAVGISKERGDLIEPINAALKELSAQGVLDDMYARWTGEAEPVMPEIAPPENPEITLKVGTVGTIVPMTYYGANGKLTGYDLELTARLAQKLNARIEADDMGFDALIAGLNSNKLDIVVSNLNITPERAEMIYYSDPYLEADLTLLIKDDAAGSFTTLKELQAYFDGAKLGVMTGSVFDQIADKYFPNAEKVYSNIESDNALLMQSGKIDGFLTDKPRAELQCAINDELWIPDITVEDDKYGIALNKDKRALLAQVNATINRLAASGELAALAEKWFLPDEADKPMSEYGFTGENGELALYADVDSYPFIYMRDEEIVGYEIEIYYKICEEHGYSPSIKSAAFAGVLAAVTTGKADMACASISITPERAEQMLFSEPVYTGGIVAVLPASMREALTGSGALDEQTRLGFFEKIARSFERTFIREQRWKLILRGLLVTLLISVCSGALGTLLGYGVCMLTRSRCAPLSAIARGYIRIVQGTPIVVLLMILYYLVFMDIEAVLVAIIGFSINLSAYVSEMMRSGIEAVDGGQMEAAGALGFTRVEAFVYITLPQAARHFLPVFRGEFISLVKMTSVVGYITIQDLTKVSDIIRSRTYEAFFPLISTAVIYFILAWLVTALITAMERRVDPAHKKRALKGVSVK